jgi:hypothetical protein
MKPNKLPYIIVSVLLGLAFLVFGLSFFIPFIPVQASYTPAFEELMRGLFSSGLMSVAKIIEVGAGVLLISQRYHNLALTLLTPVMVVIVLSHALTDPKGLPVVLVLLALNILLIAARWRTFKVVLAAR